MELIIGGLVGGAVLLMLVFALALGRASRNTSPGRAEERTIALTRLNDVRSPSGKRFYPEENSLWKLAEELEELETVGR